MNFNDRHSLHHLVKSDDNVALVRALLAGGKHRNLENSCCETPLQAAAKSNEDNPNIVQELIKAGADTLRMGRWNYTPLHYAVIRRKRRVVDVLLQSRICINQKNSYGMTALHYAVYDILPHIWCMFDKNDFQIIFPDLYIVRKLLNHKLINVDETDQFKRTALACAIPVKQLEIVKLLLNKNARVDTSDMYHRTPLHTALFYRDFRITAALLLKKASLFKMNGDGKTPLNIIINSSSLEFPRMCLKLIAFNYNLKGYLINELIKFPELSQFLKRCWDEIAHMKSDIIVNGLTVFDFFCKCVTKSGFDNPILQIYKPVIERLVTGLYPEYFCYILNRISKSTLSAVLKVTIKEKYCNIKCGAKEYSEEFSKIINIGLLSENLSCSDIFRLIVAFTTMKNGESTLDFREQEWYLADLWDEYPETHFY